MRALLILLSIFFLISCGPRDDEKQQGTGGGGGGVKAGETVRVEQQGQKLPSCSGPTDPTWNSIRLYYELNAIFDRANDLKVVLGKGSRNCVKVSSEEVVQIEKESGVDTGDFSGTGAFFFVAKLELMRTSDFLSNKELVKQVAEGMTMSEEQLLTYINAEPQRDEVTISYLETSSSKNGGTDGKPSQDNFQLSKGQQIMVFGEGAKLETCSGEKDGDWGQVRLDYGLNGIFDKAPQMTHQVLKGSRNCYRVSDKKPLTLSLQTEEGGSFENQETQFLVESIVLMNGSDFTSNPAFVDEYSKAMGFEKSEDLLTWLKDDEGNYPKFVTVTSLKLAEETAPVGTGGPVSIYKLPEAQGLKAGSCQDQGKPTWDSMRVFPDQEDVLGDALKTKKATAFISNGDFNCLVIGEKTAFSFKDTSNSWVIDGSLQYTVKEVVIRDKADFIRDGKLAEFVAAEVGLTVEDFLKYLETFGHDRVNVTRMEWVQQ